MDVNDLAHLHCYNDVGIRPGLVEGASICTGRHVLEWTKEVCIAKVRTALCSARFSADYRIKSGTLDRGAQPDCMIRKI